MGFLNPWIYSIGNRAFTEYVHSAYPPPPLRYNHTENANNKIMPDSITESKSMGCQGESFSGLPSPVIPNAGWNAVEGWDPVSGWGTPLFDKMMSASCGDVYEVES